MIFLFLASRHEWNDLGLASGWCGLLEISGLSRFLIIIFPHRSPITLWTLVVLVGGLCSVAVGQRLLRRRGWLMALPWLLGLSMLVLRSYFPQFDVDSLMYHLVAVRWFQDRSFLPPLQREAAMITNWIYFVGFEEFLTIPGLVRDLPLCAGLIGGLLKILSILTVVCLIPRQTPIFRYLAVFFFLVDDHFVYSGQNCFVYLNPSLIPLTTLIVWLSWRGARGHTQRLWMAFALGAGITSVKYHGLAFSSIPVAAFLWRIMKKMRFRREIPLPSKESALCLLAGLLPVVGVYGINLWETGSPLVLSGPFKAQHLGRGTEMLDSLWGHWSTGFLHPLRRLIYPGNLAMKAVAVLLIPSLVLWILSVWRGRSANKWVSKRWLDFTVLAWIISQVWVIIAEVSKANESRYPRYVMGLSILGLFTFVLALRPSFKCFIPSLDAHRSRIWAGLQWVAGLCVMLWIFAISDTHYVNVPPTLRPSWGRLFQFIQAKWRGPCESLDPASPWMKGMLMDYVPRNIPRLRQGLEKLERESGLALTRGDGLVVYSNYMTWPSVILSNNAILLELYSGGGYLRLPKGLQTLTQAGVRYAIVPKQTAQGWDAPWIRRSPFGPTELLEFNFQQVWESADMRIVDLRKPLVLHRQ